MKKLLFLSAIVFAVSALHAQVDFSQIRFDLGGNYTMYKGDFAQKTPGIKFKAAVPFNDKMYGGLSFAYHLPIKVAGSVSTTDGGSVAAETVYNFKTIGLEGTYNFIEENEEGFTPYGNLGASFVLVNYKEKVTGTIPSGESLVNSLESSSLSGVCINAGLGAQYSFGAPKVFAEAGIAIPANTVNNTLIYNPIPLQINFNIGIRYSLGSRED